MAKATQKVYSVEAAKAKLFAAETAMAVTTEKEQGILKELEAQGIEDGDTVRMYGFEFDYYK